jgi:hypothetical protein
VNSTIFDLLHENAKADLDLLLSCDARGDHFANSRTVDFAFKTKDRETADDLCEYINGKNFGKAHVRADEELCWVICKIEMPITQELVFCVSGFMLCLSRLFQVEYDGWGSIIQPPPSQVLT